MSLIKIAARVAFKVTSSVEPDVTVSVDLPFGLEGKFADVFPGEDWVAEGPVDDCEIGLELDNVKYDHSPEERDMGHVSAPEGMHVEFDAKIVVFCGAPVSPEDSKWLEEKMKESGTWDDMVEKASDKLAEDALSNRDGGRDDWD